jgi:hypothetical protein
LHYYSRTEESNKGRGLKRSKTKNLEQGDSNFETRIKPRGQCQNFFLHEIIKIRKTDKIKRNAIQ